jgi:uncharacterized protein (TIRG00374 family)
MREKPGKNIIDEKEFEGEPISSSKNKTAEIIKYLIAVGLLVFIVIKVKPGEILAALKFADYKYILFALILLILNIYLQYVQWKTVITTLGIEKDHKKILRSLFYGFAGGAFTPVRVGEYFGRAAALKHISAGIVTAATFVDKISTLIIILFTGTFAAIAYTHNYLQTGMYFSGTVLVLLFLMSFLLAFLLNSPDSWYESLLNRIGRENRVGKFLAHLKIIKKIDKKLTVKLLSIAGFKFFIIIAQYALLVEAFTNTPGFLYLLWAGILVMYSKTIIPSISVADLGIREGASVYFISKMGGAGPAGFNASILIFLINIIIPAAIGFVIMMRRKHD